MVVEVAKSRKSKSNSHAIQKQVFRLGEFFCGPGGLAFGANLAKVKKGRVEYSIEHEWASDYDSDSCQTFIDNICPDRPHSVIHHDVRTLDLTRLKKIDAFAYGFPCNDFSIVGEQKGFDGSFGPLYLHGVKVIDMFGPLFFVAENVGGLSSANEGKAFAKIISDLESAGKGYVTTTNLYKFEEYGVPQKRHRIIVVGMRSDLGVMFKVPKPTTGHNPIAVRTALENPPIPHSASNNELTKQSKTVVERLKFTKPGENAWTANLPEHLKLNVKGAKLSQIYRRLDPDKPSYTITGSGGGGTHGYHWLENRALTSRERARIQTFPDNYVFHGSKESVRKQIGMAVPPLGVKIIFEAILKTLAGVDYPHVNASWSTQVNLFRGAYRD